MLRQWLEVVSKQRSHDGNSLLDHLNPALQDLG